MRKLLMTAALLTWPLGVAAQDLTDERIKELALQAILENPQIIMEAVAILDQERGAQQAVAHAQTLAQQRDLLENDPNAPFMGNADAGTVVVEFFDYNCPYCKRAANDVKALLAADSDIKVVYREWPILGEGSVLAARAALAAHAQGKYEEMHWALMEIQGRAEEASILAAARSVGLDVAKLIDDMESDAVNSHLAVSQGLARDLGFTGTPAFVIGDALVPGAVPLDELQELVAQARTDG
jgi:protein-disulfide isomerase